MRPFFLVVSATSGDLTGKLLDRILRIAVVDAEGTENDTLEVELDDRGQKIALPAMGERLDVWMGYQGGAIALMGAYVVDELTLSGPPLAIAFMAKGADMTSRIRAPRNLTRRAEGDEGLTLGQLAREIAQEYDLEPRIHPDADAIPVGHIDQVGESDMALLTRLADIHDLTLTLSAAELLLRPHGGWLAPDDPFRPPPVFLDARQIGRYRWQSQSRTQYTAVRAYHYDPDTAQRIPVTYGDDSGERPLLELRHDARDADEALDLAKARYQQNERGQAKLSLDLPGNPYVQAGAALTVTGLSAPVGGVWVIERVTHRIDAGGYTMSVEAVPPNSAGEQE